MGCHIIKGEIIYINDMVNLILQRIDYSSVWKNIRSVSKNIYLLSLKYQRIKLIELANPILSLMYVYPEQNWNLLDKHIITIDFIRLTYNELPWNKRMISMSSNITINDILNADPDSIDWEEISRNSSIKVSDILKYDYLPWNYKYTSENISIRIEDVRNNLSKIWNFDRLAINSSLSIGDLSTIMDLTTNAVWWENKNATYNDIVKYSKTVTIVYHMYGYIKFILLNEDILQLYIDRLPNIKAYEINKQSITPNIIKDNPQLDWDFILIDYTKFTIEEMMNIPVIEDLNVNRILNHPDFTIDDFFKYFDINSFYKWDLLSRSPWLTFDIVLEYKDIILWDHEWLSANPNVTVDILEDSDFSWIRWDYKWLSRYAQLNWVYIIEHSDKVWDFYNLSHNKSLIR